MGGEVTSMGIMTIIEMKIMRKMLQSLGWKLIFWVSRTIINILIIDPKTKLEFPKFNGTR